MCVCVTQEIQNLRGEPIGANLTTQGGPLDGIGTHKAHTKGIRKDVMEKKVNCIKKYRLNNHLKY